MKPITYSKLGDSLEKEYKAALRTEEVVNPVLAILAILVVLMLWSLPVLDMMGKLPKP